MKKWTIGLLLLFWAWLLPAQNTAMLFLPVNRDAATVGGTQVLSSLYNPAAIPFTGSDVQLSYQRWAPSVAPANHINLLSGIRIGKRVGVGLTVGYQMGEEFALTDGSFFMPSDLLVGLGAGVAFTDYLSIGVNAKYARQGLTKEVAYQAFAADAFFLFNMAGFRVAAGVASVGTPVKAAGGKSYALPAAAKIGAGYGFDFGLSLQADANVFFAGGFAVAGGVQYAWKDMLFARAGYHYGSASAPVPSYLALGLGVKFIGIHLDVSYLTASKALGNSFTIGIGYAF